jgi:hypothetical protein
MAHGGIGRRVGGHRKRLAVLIAVAAMASSISTLIPGRALAATTTPAATIAPAAKTAAKTGSCARPVPFRRGNFKHPTRIDNKWLPMIPGTRFVLEGSVAGDGGSAPHTVITTVTGLTKVIDGVKTRVVLDVDLDGDVPQEIELAFFAQDDDGNVWSMGEYPEEYVDGVFDGAPSTWISGLAKARAGVMMLAEPRLKGPRYVQGSAPKVDFLDCARVFKKGRQVCVPVTCYSKVLVTDENSPLDPGGGHQRKFYAPRVGNVKVTAVGDPEAETLRLTRLVHLDCAALREVNRAALRLDRRGYRVSDVYARTPRARLS